MSAGDETPYPDGGCLADLANELELESRILGRDLRAWAKRDESRAQPEVRRAVNRAMESIDRTLDELYRAWRQLIDEIHAYDKAALCRADELLARCRREREDRTGGAR